MITEKIKVLIVDDSAVIRGLLARSLESDPNIDIIGTAMHGERALAHMRREAADVLLMDVEMPVMDGITTLKVLHDEFPDAKVIMVSGHTQEGAKTTVEALSLGAVACVAKPVCSSSAESVSKLSQELVPLVNSLGSRKSPQKSAPVERPVEPAFSDQQAPKPDLTPEVIVIGTSTGGPNALNRIFSQLPAELPLPIFIVQHMPPMFTGMLAKQLERDTGRPTVEATDGGLVQPGHTYIAPGDYHLEVHKEEGQIVTRLTQEEQEHFCRPSVNPLFRSVAQIYGNKTLGVILTGMGEDGFEGSQELVKAGGFLIAQDEASCVVWGMPRAVTQAGLAHQILPLDEVAEKLMEHCKQGVLARD